MKKIFFITISIILISFIGCNTNPAEKNPLTAEQFLDENLDTSFTPQNKAQQIVYNMQFGWNLGNTLDALPRDNKQNAGLSTETAWNMPYTTQEMIKGLKNLGINTIRIPISWHNHILDENYTIDPKWMARVKQIVDWAYAEDMYIIMNIHHDNADSEQNFKYGKGFYPSVQCKDESIRFLTRIWEQISNTFNNDYNEKLVFEVLNEPRMCGHEHEWWYNSNCSTCKEAMSILLEFNQLCLDTIRKSGGNNATRLVMIPSLCASPDSVLHSDFSLPTDSAENGLAVSVHMYTPYNFAMETPGRENFTNDHRKELDIIFSNLNKTYISKGIPVVIGEMGATNKDNLEERAAWFGYFVQHSRQYGMSACLWDNGVPEPSRENGEKYGYYNRNKQEWYFPLLIEIALKASSIK